jgi:protein SCO1/2
MTRKFFILMTRKFFIAVILSAAAFASAQNCSAQAQTAGQPSTQSSSGKAPHDHAHMNDKAEEQTPAQKYFTDVELVSQDGQRLRFYSDVLKGKTVVVNAFFTTCTSVCPPMNRNLEKVQEALGDRIGKDVFIVSISVDPSTDTPERLKAYSQKFHAKPGWLFLTGKKENVDWALYKVGQYVEEKTDHTTGLIIGNEATGLWKKAFGLAKPAELVEIVESVVNDKGGAR